MLKTLRSASATRLLHLGATLALASASLNAQQAKATSEQARTITLQEAITLALQHSRELQLAHLEEKESKAKKDIARAAYFPNIKNESAVLHVTELSGVQIPAGVFGHSAATGLIPSESLFLGQGQLTTYTSGTGLAQPFTQLLRIHEFNRAAADDLSISHVKADDAERQTSLQVRQLFYSILIAQATTEADRLNIAAIETKNSETTQDVADGKALEVSALEAHAALLDAKHSLLTQQISIRNLTMNLNDIMGLPIEAPLTLTEPEVYPITIPARDEAIRQAETGNAKIRSAELTVDKARAGYKAAREKYIPDVTGLARYSYQSGVPFLVHNFGTFGFALTYEVFDGGKRHAEVEESKTKLNQAEVNLDNVKESVRIQVESAYNKLEELQSLAAVAQESYDTCKELARVTGEQMLRSAALPSARDQALAKMNQAKASLFQATLGLSLAQANVLTLIGQMAK
jgi:outer membrane protein TolC